MEVKGLRSRVKDLRSKVKEVLEVFVFVLVFVLVFVDNASIKESYYRI